jgi:hypothetical protein
VGLDEKDLEDHVLDIEVDVLEYADRTRSSRMRTIVISQSVASSKSTCSLTRTAKTENKNLEGWLSMSRTSRTMFSRSKSVEDRV